MSGKIIYFPVCDGKLSIRALVFSYIYPLFPWFLCASAIFFMCSSDIHGACSAIDCIRRLFGSALSFLFLSIALDCISSPFLANENTLHLFLFLCLFVLFPTLYHE